MEAKRKRLMRVAAAGAVVLGLAAGSYGVASAASGSASGSGGNLTAASGPTSPAPSREPWGGQRSDETLLTGDTASKVQAAAVAKVSGGTVVRVETDADGNAAYEVHMVSSDGTPVTVYVDKQFDVVRVETGMPAGPGQRRQA